MSYQNGNSSNGNDTYQPIESSSVKGAFPLVLWIYLMGFRRRGVCLSDNARWNMKSVVATYVAIRILTIDLIPPLYCASNRWFLCSPNHA